MEAEILQGTNELKYECSNCGAIQQILTDDKISKYKCTCKKGTWKLIAVPLDHAKYVYGKAYERIVALMRGYLDLPDDYYHLVAIWIIGTYLHSSFNTYPFLFVNAMRGSGKTRLLKFISALSYGSQGDVQTGLSEAVLFRTPKGVTLVLDECEKLGHKDTAIFREYLNACYKKGGAVSRTKKVKKADKEDYVIDRFEPFRPFAMANINGIEEVLADRSLWLILEKSNNLAITKILEDFDTNPEFQAIKNELTELSVVMCSVVLLQKYVEKWNTYVRSKYSTILYTTTLPTQLYTYTPQTAQEIADQEFCLAIDSIHNLYGRNLEIIFPLLIVAKTINEDLFKLLLRISKDIIQSKKTDEIVESKDVSVLEFIATKCKPYVLEHINMTELLGLFKEFLGNSVEDTDWLNTRWLGLSLKRLNLITDKRRIARGIEVMLNVSKAQEGLNAIKRGEDETQA